VRGKVRDLAVRSDNHQRLPPLLHDPLDQVIGRPAPLGIEDRDAPIAVPFHFGRSTHPGIKDDGDPVARPLPVLRQASKQGMAPLFQTDFFGLPEGVGLADQIVSIDDQVHDR